ncbi:uncharacterized protein LOC143039805 [Oratosquilla oratoria]|uniref:uncharacterized protein LOC143039805 n=1 Tax=Oratosquilla oratoria TaxID=337810 RepID=UPI003F763C04
MRTPSRRKVRTNKCTDQELQKPVLHSSSVCVTVRKERKPQTSRTCTLKSEGPLSKPKSPQDTDEGKANAHRRDLSTTSQKDNRSQRFGNVMGHLTTHLWQQCARLSACASSFEGSSWNVCWWKNNDVLSNDRSVDGAVVDSRASIHDEDPVQCPEGLGEDLPAETAATGLPGVREEPLGVVLRVVGEIQRHKEESHPAPDAALAAPEAEKCDGESEELQKERKNAWRCVDPESSLSGDEKEENGAPGCWEQNPNSVMLLEDHPLDNFVETAGAKSIEVGGDHCDGDVGYVDVGCGGNGGVSNNGGASNTSDGITRSFSFPASALGVRTPTISWISKEKVVDIGATVQLECSVQFSQDYPVLWVKRGMEGSQDLPISTGPSLIIRESRYALRHDTGSSSYILQIKDIQETDGGEYMCQVIIGINNRITATVDLLVRMPPVISDNSTRSIVVAEHAPAKLECYAGGVPTPTISWRKENNAILPTGSSIYKGNILQIPSVRKEDRGTYYCIADNAVGRGARRNIAVEVEFPPIVKPRNPRMFQALQYDMDLECNVEAYPPAAISWIHNSETIVNNQHYRISQFATADEYTDTTLRILSVEKRQYGNYTCMATNILGQSSAVLTLEESITPVCPPACQTRDYSSPAHMPTPKLGLLAPLALSAVVLFRTFH